MLKCGGGQRTRAGRLAAVLAGLLLVCGLFSLTGCAPRQPAPVEDRSPGRPAAPAQRRPAPPLYEVQRGDTLYSIAFRYRLDWRQVAEWNRISEPYTIRPGQELRLTAPPAVVATPSRGPRPPSQQTPAPEPRAPAPRPAPPVSTPPPPSTQPEQAPAPSPRPSAAPASVPASPGAAAQTRSVAGVVWQWPTAGRSLRPFDPAATRRGLGIFGQLGQPVHAAADGTVVYSGTALIGYGELIIIKHSESMLSAYGHNQTRLVEEGDRVRRGQLIAEMGLNERDEEILHFEIRRNGQAEDPARFLPARN